MPALYSAIASGCALSGTEPIEAPASGLLSCVASLRFRQRAAPPTRRAGIAAIARIRTERVGAAIRWLLLSSPTKAPVVVRVGAAPCRLFGGGLARTR